VEAISNIFDDVKRLLHTQHLDKPAKSTTATSSIFIPIVTSTILLTNNPHRKQTKIISNGKNYNFHRKEFRRKKNSVDLDIITKEDKTQHKMKMELRNFLNFNILLFFTYYIY